MAALIFETGRYMAFLGVFFFLLFGISLWMFRRALDDKGLSLGEHDGLEETETRIGAIDIGETVHYLRRRDYYIVGGERAILGQTYRGRIVWPFYLGVWSFCLGLALMSVTFGFVLFE